MQPRRTRIDTTPTDTLSKEYTKPAPQASVDIHGLHETVLVDEVRCESCHASLCGVLMCSVCVCVWPGCDDVATSRTHIWPFRRWHLR